MNAELEAIKSAVEGEDFPTARSLSDAYVTANPDQYSASSLGIDPDDVPGLVAAVDVFRDRGLEEWQWRVEAWILHHVPPQDIGGEYVAPLNPDVITSATAEKGQ